MKAKSKVQIMERISAIRMGYEPLMSDRYRIRAIMNGGEAGLKALLGNKVNLQSSDLPALNTFLSGVTRLAHTLGKVPDIKALVPPPSRGLNQEKQQEKADKRGRIVKHYDGMRLKRQMRQHARWLPGLGYAVWVLTEYEDYEGNLYPIAESRDPMNTYPGFWSHTEDPSEMITTRYIPEEVLKHRYGIDVPGSNNQITITGANGATAYRAGVEVIEYFDEGHTYMYVPTIERVIAQIENPLTSGPKFVVAQRTSFDQMRGQYDDAIGLLAFFAKLSILSFIATEDAVFRETNIYGGFRNVKYKRGRYAVNHFPRDAKVDKPGSDIPQIAFAQIDRIERNLRTATQYPVTEDGISPMSFVTGEGISRLNQPSDRTVDEYQDIFAEAIQKLDTRRLEWDTKMYPDHKKPMHGLEAGLGFDEEYTPSKDIGTSLRTTREYGVMAGLDDPTKIVASLQLFQAGVVDLDFVRGSIKGLGDLDKLRDGSRRDRAEQALYGALEQQSAEGDPRAMMALTEIFTDPDQAGQILKKFNTPQEPQLTPEEQLMAQGLDPNAPQGPVGPPPDAQTVLTQLSQTGSVAGGGVQTVGRIP